MYIAEKFKLCRILFSRSLSFSFTLSICFILLLRTGIHKYQNGLVVNGTAYELRGEISVPMKPNYSCPYFTLIPPATNPKSYQRKCNTCAIVSSSGRLLKSKSGDVIDAAECVFRINNASTEVKYQEDVGRKSSIRILSSRGLDEYFERLSNEEIVKPEDILIWDANIRLPRLDRVTLKAIKLADIYPSLKVYILQNHVRGLPSFDTFIDREVGLSSTLTGSSCSSGFYAMTVAAYICDSIAVYGMSSPEDCFESNLKKRPQAPYHYQPPYDTIGECDMYKSRWKRSIHGHRFMTEHMIFKRWSKHRQITFRVPSW